MGNLDKKEILNDFDNMKKDVNDVLNEELEIVTSEPMDEEAREMISESLDAVHQDFDKLFELVQDYSLRNEKEQEFREMLKYWKSKKDKVSAITSINGILDIFNSTCDELAKELRK